MLMERDLMYKGLTKLKSEEEYEAKKAELKYYVEEYTWISNSKEPLKDITLRMRSMLDRLEKEENKDVQTDLLKAIHALQVKYITIKKEEYIPTLKQNITASLVLIEQYEASLEKHSPLKIAFGMLSGNPEIKSYLQRRFIVSSANRNYAAPNAVDLRLEKMEDILEYIDKNYNLVEIKLPTSETGLVLVNEEVENPVKTKIQEMTEEFLVQNVKRAEDIESPKLSEEKVDLNKHHSSSKQKNKEHDEREI